MVHTLVRTYVQNPCMFGREGKKVPPQKVLDEKPKVKHNETVFGIDQKCPIITQTKQFPFVIAVRDNALYVSSFFPLLLISFLNSINDVNFLFSVLFVHRILLPFFHLNVFFSVGWCITTNECHFQIEANTKKNQSIDGSALEKRFTASSFKGKKRAIMPISVFCLRLNCVCVY